MKMTTTRNINLNLLLLFLFAVSLPQAGNATDNQEKTRKRQRTELNQLPEVTDPVLDEAPKDTSPVPSLTESAANSGTTNPIATTPTALAVTSDPNRSDETKRPLSEGASSDTRLVLAPKLAAQPNGAEPEPLKLDAHDLSHFTENLESRNAIKDLRTLRLELEQKIAQKTVLIARSNSQPTDVFTEQAHLAELINIRGKIDEKIKGINELFNAVVAGDVPKATSLLKAGISAFSLSNESTYRSPFIAAASVGSTTMGTLLLTYTNSNFFDPPTIEWHLYRAAQAAAKTGNHEFFRLLISTGIDPRINYVNSPSLVHEATENNQSHFIAMLAHQGVDFNSPAGEDSQTPLRMAFAYLDILYDRPGAALRTDVFRALLAGGATTLTPSLSEKPVRNWVKLYQFLGVLIEERLKLENSLKNPDLPPSHQKRARSTLFGMERLQGEVIRTLGPLTKIPEVSRTKEDDFSNQLNLIIASDNLEAFRSFVQQHQINPLTWSNRWTEQKMIHTVVVQGSVNILNYLVSELKADPNELLGEQLYTPLHLAAISENPTVVTILLENKANQNALSKSGETAASLAARYGDVKMLTEFRRWHQDFSVAGPGQAPPLTVLLQNSDHLSHYKLRHLVSELVLGGADLSKERPPMLTRFIKDVEAIRSTRNDGVLLMELSERFNRKIEQLEEQFKTIVKSGKTPQEDRDLADLKRQIEDKAQALDIVETKLTQIDTIFQLVGNGADDQLSTFLKIGTSAPDIVNAQMIKVDMWTTEILTPLVVAAERNSILKAEILLQFMPQVDRRAHLVLAAKRAAELDRKSFLEFLLSQPELDIRPDTELGTKTGTDLLQIAIKSGAPRAVSVILSKNPELIRARDASGRTPLHVAILSAKSITRKRTIPNTAGNTSETILNLLRANADPDETLVHNEQTISAIQLAKVLGMRPLVGYLSDISKIRKVQTPSDFSKLRYVLKHRLERNEASQAQSRREELKLEELQSDHNMLSSLMDELMEQRNKVTAQMSETVVEHKLSEQDRKPPTPQKKDKVQKKRKLEEPLAGRSVCLICGDKATPNNSNNNSNDKSSVEPSDEFREFPPGPAGCSCAYCPNCAGNTLTVHYKDRPFRIGTSLLHCKTCKDKKTLKLSFIFRNDLSTEPVARFLAEGEQEYNNQKKIKNSRSIEEEIVVQKKRLQDSQNYVFANQVHALNSAAFSKLIPETKSEPDCTQTSGSNPKDPAMYYPCPTENCLGYLEVPPNGDAHYFCALCNTDHDCLRCGKNHPGSKCPPMTKKEFEEERKHAEAFLEMAEKAGDRDEFTNDEGRIDPAILPARPCLNCFLPNSLESGCLAIQCQHCKSMQHLVYGFPKNHPLYETKTRFDDNNVHTFLEHEPDLSMHYFTEDPRATSIEDHQQTPTIRETLRNSETDSQKTEREKVQNEKRNLLIDNMARTRYYKPHKKTSNSSSSASSSNSSSSSAQGN